MFIWRIKRKSSFKFIHDILFSNMIILFWRKILITACFGKIHQQKKKIVSDQIYNVIYFFNSK